MSLNVAVQMDTIGKINVAGDSTLALMLEAQARGHRLFYYEPVTLALREGRLMANGC
ncbi:MAG TPA: glutathione synthase, partial [Aestuariivirgaceae bacterium]|nr:glutathione synthase [Aestuariivirgaceae bacterium]